jgi:DNA-binding XRE family transcriptional regulator
MSQHPFKNYLRTCRKGLGLDQSHLALILKLKSVSRISAMETGKELPTVRECVIFQILFNRSFEELWPRVALEVENATETNILALVTRLQNQMWRTDRKKTRAAVVRGNLRSVINRRSKGETTYNQ